MPSTGSGKDVAGMLADNPRMTTQGAYEKAAGAPEQHNRFGAMLKSPELPAAVTLPKQGLPMKVLYKHDGRPGERE